MGSSCSKSAGVKDAPASSASASSGSGGAHASASPAALDLTAVSPDEATSPTHTQQQQSGQTYAAGGTAGTKKEGGAPPASEAPMRKSGSRVVLVRARSNSAHKPEQEKEKEEEKDNGAAAPASADADADAEQTDPPAIVTVAVDGVPVELKSKALSVDPSESSIGAAAGGGAPSTTTTPAHSPLPVSTPLNSASPPTPLSRRLSERRLSGAFANQVASPSSSGSSTGGVRRVSRPSTPRSRVDRPLSLIFPAAMPPLYASMGATGSTSALSGVGATDPLGWSVAPNALSVGSPPLPYGGLGLGLSPSARAARRRTDHLIPETIQEQIRERQRQREPGMAVSHRRASGGPLLERNWAMMMAGGKSTLPQLLQRGGVQGQGQGQDMDHLSVPSPFGVGFGARLLQTSRGDLTEAQQQDLKSHPWKWTDPSIYSFYMDEMFSYYSTLPLPSSSQSPSPAPSPSASAKSLPIAAAAAAAVTATNTAASSSSLTLPSIHQADRIVWGQIQLLARDCVRRAAEQTRAQIRAQQQQQQQQQQAQQSESSASAQQQDGATPASSDAAPTPTVVLDDASLEKSVWSHLESMLPGHGKEASTVHFVSLYFLHSLARVQAGSVGRREFALLFPPAHAALFAPVEPGVLHARERKRMVQQIYTLKLEELMRPFPAATAAANAEGQLQAESQAAAAAAVVAPSLSPSSSSSSSSFAAVAFAAAQPLPPLPLSPSSSRSSARTSLGGSRRKTMSDSEQATMLALVGATSRHSLRAAGSSAASAAGSSAEVAGGTATATATATGASTDSPSTRTHMRRISVQPNAAVVGSGGGGGDGDAVESAEGTVGERTRERDRRASRRRTPSPK